MVDTMQARTENRAPGVAGTVAFGIGVGALGAASLGLSVAGSRLGVLGAVVVVAVATWTSLRSAFAIGGRSDEITLLQVAALPAFIVAAAGLLVFSSVAVDRSVRDDRTPSGTCAEAAGPIRSGDAGYSAARDHDGDGIACE